MKSFQRIWALSLFVKLLISALIPLSADEAYYWVWAQNPQLSYFDHPPMVSWLFWLGHFLEPFLNSVRWPAVILGHGVLGVWFYILRNDLSYERFKIWIWLVLFSPLLGFGSLVITPDLPVLFFWSLSLALTLKALESKSLGIYLALGASLGLGFCSKYHIVLFIPCLIAYLSVERKWKEVRWPGVALTVISGLLFCLPVIIWNFQNNFASFEFQLKHGLEKTSYDIEWTISYVFGQILLLFPLIFWAALRARLPQELHWLRYFGWGPLLFFLLTSFRASTEANWPIIGYPALLACALFHPKIQSWLKSYLIFWGLLISFVLSAMVIPSFRGVYEKLEEPFVFQEMSNLVTEFQPLYADSYQMASSLWYFSKTPVYKLKEMSRLDYFDTFPQAVPSEAKFYLLKRADNSLPSWFSEQKWDMREVRRVSKNFILLEFKRP